MMDFDPEKLLRNSTSRAKSDVANKLVSMLLHDLSRRVTQSHGLSVNSTIYAKFATGFFNGKCPYCHDKLVANKVAVEHLEGMNRFRAGLHVPGNVIVCCKICNLEKRRDDQLLKPVLGQSGWESFLFHGLGRCAEGCKTCGYWHGRFTDSQSRQDHLDQARRDIYRFQQDPLIAGIHAESLRLQDVAREKLEMLYREGQEYARSRIAELGVQITTDRSYLPPDFGMGLDPR
jgi:hypothetical protein